MLQMMPCRIRPLASRNALLRVCQCWLIFILWRFPKMVIPYTSISQTILLKAIVLGYTPFRRKPILIILPETSSEFLSCYKILLSICFCQTRLLSCLPSWFTCPCSSVSSHHSPFETGETEASELQHPLVCMAECPGCVHCR